MAILQSFLDGAIDAKHFLFYDSSFVAEASDLKGLYTGLYQIYDDAVDIGIAIRNEKTGVVMKFHLQEVHRDGDGDITFWEFRPTSDHLTDQVLAKLKVIIYND